MPDTIPPEYDHHWTAGKRFLSLDNHRDAVVAMNPTTGKGYLWQYRKRYGYAESIERAKEWVETMAEYHSIPAKQRWLAPL